MSDVDKQTSIYLHWGTKSALLDMALEKQAEVKRKVSPNEVIIDMISALRPDIAAKHGLVTEDDNPPEYLAPTRVLEAAI